MLIAVVTGSVWSTRRIDGIPTGALLEVEVEGSGERFVALDVLASGIGERVLVTTGSAAAAWFGGDRFAPIDALIVGNVDDDAPDETGDESYAMPAESFQGRPSRFHSAPIAARQVSS